MMFSELLRCLSCEPLIFILVYVVDNSQAGATSKVSYLQGRQSLGQVGISIVDQLEAVGIYLTW